MAKLTAQDPYFGKSGEFANKYGTFTDSLTMGQHISSVIEDRSLEHAKEFESNISSFLSELKKSSAAEKEFFRLMDEFRAYGLVQMALRRAKHSEYHTAEHAAELGDDTEQVLTETYKTDFSKSSEQLANKFFIAIAKAAASWHDIVQDRGAPPNNEIDSAAEFVIRMNEMLEKFKIKFPSMANAVSHLQSELNFLSKELIVNATWLVLGMEPEKVLVARTLNERVTQVVADYNVNRREEDKIQLGDGALARRLDHAVNTISVGDTKRFSLKHVLKSKLVLKALNSLPKENKSIVEDFFRLANIAEDVDKEIFLGLMCQNIRIFPELNRPPKEVTPHNSQVSRPHQIPKVEYESYVDICDSLKSNPSARLNKDMGWTMFNNFMKTENAAGKSNLDREIIFAKAQQDPMWTRHAQHLEIFAKFVAQLNGDKAKAKEHLAETLILLATRFQPGCSLLKVDKTFHAQLREVEKMQNKIWEDISEGTKVVPSPELSPINAPRKALTSQQSAVELAFSSFGIKNFLLPIQARTNLHNAIERFCGSLFSHFFSHFRKQSKVYPLELVAPAQPIRSSLVRGLFKTDSSKSFRQESDSSKNEFDSLTHSTRTRSNTQSDILTPRSQQKHLKTPKQSSRAMPKTTEDKNELSETKVKKP